MSCRMSSGVAESEGVGAMEESVFFCLTIYPEGLSVVNADATTLDVIKATAESAFPQGLKSVAETEAGVMIKFASSTGGNFLFSNPGE